MTRTPGGEGASQARPIERGRALPGRPPTGKAPWERPPVDGPSQAVQDAPEEPGTHADLQPSPGPPDPSARDHRPGVPERQQEGRVAAERHHLGSHGASPCVDSTSTCSARPAPTPAQRSRNGRDVAERARSHERSCLPDRVPSRGRAESRPAPSSLPLGDGSPELGELGPEPAVDGRALGLDDHLAGPELRIDDEPQSRRSRSPASRLPRAVPPHRPRLARRTTFGLPRTMARARSAAATPSRPGRTSRPRIRSAISIASSRSSVEQPASRRSRSAAPRTTSAAARASPVREPLGEPRLRRRRAGRLGLAHRGAQDAPGPIFRLGEESPGGLPGVPGLGGNAPGSGGSAPSRGPSRIRSVHAATSPAALPGSAAPSPRPTASERPTPRGGVGPG